MALRAFVCCNSFREVLLACKRLRKCPCKSIRAVHGGAAAAALALCAEVNLIIAANALCQCRKEYGLREFMDACLPANAHEQVAGVLTIICWSTSDDHMTTIRRFPTRADLLNGIVAAVTPAGSWYSYVPRSSAWEKRGIRAVINQHINVIHSTTIAQHSIDPGISSLDIGDILRD